jgi:predicted HTH transcriptional regulator
MQTAKTESDLLRLLHSTEHTFVERKTVGDTRDCVKAVVAFANTLPHDQDGVLFVGAIDAGEIEAHSSSLDKIQKGVADRLQSVYPAVYYTTKTVQEGGKECLAIIVPGSPSRPHFAGQLFVRDGSRTVVASAGRHESMLAARTTKTYELQKWEGQVVTVRTLTRQSGVAYVINESKGQGCLVAANQFYITVDMGNRTLSHPLKRVEISYDHIAKRLELEIEGLPQAF